TQMKMLEPKVRALIPDATSKLMGQISVLISSFLAQCVTFQFTHSNCNQEFAVFNRNYITQNFFHFSQPQESISNRARLQKLLTFEEIVEFCVDGTQDPESRYDFFLNFCKFYYQSGAFSDLNESNDYLQQHMKAELLRFSSESNQQEAEKLKQEILK